MSELQRLFPLFFQHFCIALTSSRIPLAPTEPSYIGKIRTLETNSRTIRTCTEVSAIFHSTCNVALSRPVLIHATLVKARYSKPFLLWIKSLFLRRPSIPGCAKGTDGVYSCHYCSRMDIWYLKVSPILVPGRL